MTLGSRAEAESFQKARSKIGRTLCVPSRESCPMFVATPAARMTVAGVKPRAETAQWKQDIKMVK
jgi:hypothetical protein